MAEKIRWGILGTGNIAHQFSTGVANAHRGTLAAVGSRRVETAQTFAQNFHIPVAHGNYDELIADPNIDAIYNSAPNSLHQHWTIQALRAGKHVLCEKPLAMNAAEAEEMFDEAARAGRVLVEAFMYRAHPLTAAVLAAVKSGAIGTLRLIRTSFCYRTRKIEGNVRFVKELGGGGLMDIGCYCVDFARLVAGAAPISIQAAALFHPTGVDDLLSATLTFPNQIISSFTCGMSAQANNTAYICGSEGYIEIPVPWKPPRDRAAYIITRGTPPKMDNDKQASIGPPPRDIRYINAGADLYAIEADHFAATILDHAPALVSREESIGTMQVLDEMRRQIGLNF